MPGSDADADEMTTTMTTTNTPFHSIASSESSERASIKALEARGKPAGESPVSHVIEEVMVPNLRRRPIVNEEVAPLFPLQFRPVIQELTNKSSVRRFSVLLQIDAQIVEFLVALLIAASFELLRRSFDGKCASAEDNTDNHRIDAKYFQFDVGV